METKIVTKLESLSKKNKKFKNQRQKNCSMSWSF